MAEKGPRKQHPSSGYRPGASKNRLPNFNNPNRNLHHQSLPKWPNKKGTSTTDKKQELDKSKTKLSFLKLEELSREQDSLKVSVELANTHNGLAYLLAQDVFLKERPDWILLLAKLFVKVCQCGFPENKTKVLNTVIESEFIEFIIHCVHNLSSGFDKEKTESFLKDVYLLIETLVKTFPTSLKDKLHSPVQQIYGDISCIEQFGDFHIDELIKTNFIKLECRLRDMQSMNESLLERGKKHLDEGEPPEDFRTFELYPNEEEIRITKHAFLRRNIVDGGYKSVEHYLDIQFRLLREDLMIPLREGFAELLDKLSRKEYKKIKVNYLRYFEHCCFKSITTAHGTISYNVCFDVDRKLNHINWEYNQWFKYGSLVFFSFDNFSSFLVGKVVEKNNKDCRDHRMISVELIGDKELNTEDWDKSAIMVESTIFFQPYYHVMKALKKFNEDNFPLVRYIVEVNRNIQPPAYLLQDSYMEIGNFNFNVLDDFAWPSAEKLSLDEFQYEALKSALTKEFAIMQGPPGTGKTYLGLKIVEALVNYKRKREVYNFDIDSNEHFMSPAHLNQLGTNEKLIRWLLLSNDFLLDDKYSEFLLENSDVHKNGKESEENDLNNSEDEDEVRQEFKNDESMISAMRNEFSTTEQNMHSVSLCGLLLQKEELEHRSTVLEYNYDDYYAESDEYAWKRWRLESELKNVCYSIDIIVKQSKKIDFNFTSQNVKTLSSNLITLNIDERWNLYSLWVNNLRSGLMNSIKTLEKRYRDMSEQLQEARQLEDLNILRHFKIVGITTTAAAKNHLLLTALRPNIVIVEEAAEVLEAHIVTALTDHCQHLILIGDHQQLRPNPSVYKLAKQYNLEISLFERMINNKLSFSRLGVQHRMRPEICDLITPAIYPNLQNHPSVYEFSHVKGVTKNLFFVTHEVEEVKDDTMQSYRNPYEGDFILKLVHYLLLQGYTSEQITILTTYSGQLIYLKMEKKTLPLLNDVRLTTVDNYQGEECKIIILSLVRSNPEDKIGFLATSNRVCVALSRAKEGFYLIGNMKALENGSDIWKCIKNKLEEHNAIGTQLELECLIHQNKTLVKEKHDFLMVAEGGCSMTCDTLLNCGHKCKKLCHSYDLMHERFQCLESCNKLCPEAHPCSYQCYQCATGCLPCMVIMKNLSLACGHIKDICCSEINTYKCTENVEAFIELCGHTALVPCYAVTSGNIKCPKPCDIRLPCGHQCTQNCHKDKDPDHIDFKCMKKCEKLKKGCLFEHNCDKMCSEPCQLCNETVIKELPCGHKQEGLCHLDVMECLQPCDKTLECDHPCKKRCKDKCGDCNVLVDKIIPECGHTVNMKCKTIPNGKLCQSACQKLLPCGHACSKKCNEVCTPIIECSVLVLHSSVQSLCPHPDVLVPCKYGKQSTEKLQDWSLKNCRQPCAETLLCGHTCTGTCGECQQKRFHKVCNEQCERIHICGHRCRLDCSSPCPPCEARCSYKCRHMTCKRSCNERCKPCYDECSWQCKHETCRMSCSEFCKRRRCYKACQMELKCGHQCIGFCSEPCPDKCRFCDEDEVSSEYFGTEKKPNAKFVLLEDCGHFFESDGLEIYLGIRQNPHESRKMDTEISVKTCPKCKKPIVSTLRYMNNIRFIQRNIGHVKMLQKKLMTNKPFLQQKLDLILKIRTIETSNLIIAGSKYFSEILENISRQVQDYTRDKRGKRKPKFLSPDQLRLFTFLVDCLKCLDTGFIDFYNMNPSRASKIFLLNQVDAILWNAMHIPNNKISQQLKYDYFCEIDRVYALVNSLSLSTNYREFEHFQNKATLIEMCKTHIDEIHSLGRFDETLSRHIDERMKTLKSTIEQNIPFGMNFDEIEMKKPDPTIWRDLQDMKLRWYKCYRDHFYYMNEDEAKDSDHDSTCPECARRDSKRRD
ncbi:hypothetical protein M8J77_010544 [Diaphorina citri]|nr:hypothetical protein M8J77_010544 [Diaphorina citri]